MAESVQRVFENQAIRVTFPESGFAEQPIQVPTQSPTQSASSEADYFSRYLQQIRFCRQPQLPPYMQQVHSGDGWLCSFYVLPPLGEAEARAEILKRRSARVEITYQRAEGIGLESHLGRPMLVWREQSGKTRLDHFLILDPEANYLFVSSPYGDGEMLRQTVATLIFLPR